MARARNIKPGFFKNEDLAECSPWARLCFAGLWTLADREGRLEDRAKRIKGELFPFDSIEVEPLLVELQRWKFIERYTAEGAAVIQVREFKKHQTPHFKEVASELPPPQSPGFDTHSMGTKPKALPPLKEGDTGNGSVLDTHSTGVEPPDSKGGQPPLNPDPGFLIADSPSLNPDPPFLIADPGLFAEAPSAPPPAAAAPKKEPPTVGTWKAYSSSYEVRYRVPPVRNATVNGQLSNLVARLGADEAPAVAAFYVRSNNSRYVGAGHSVGMLLMDAEKLRTEWATGQQATAAHARLVDQTQTNANAFAGMLAEAKQKEAHGQH